MDYINGFDGKILELNGSSFHGYVKLPEGIWIEFNVVNQIVNPQVWWYPPVSGKIGDGSVLVLPHQLSWIE